MNDKCQVNTCDITNALNEIKPRYNAVIIYSLYKENKGFTQIRKEFSYMSNEQINRSLKDLVKSGILEKNITYALTPKGVAIYDILKLLEQNYINFTTH